MTLPTSGSISADELNTELGITTGTEISIGDARVRLMAGVPSGAISFSDLHGKSSVCIVDTVTTSANSSLTRTFSGVNFGVNYPGRVLVACVCLHNVNNTNMSITSGTIGSDSSTTGRVQFENTASNGSVSVGMISASGETGTSGDVVITHNGTSQDALLIMLSMDASAQTTSDNDGVNGGGAGGSSTGNLSLNIPADGTLLQVCGIASTNNISMSGVDEQHELSAFGASLVVGFNTHKNAQTSDTTSSSWSGTHAFAAVACSWAHG